MLKLKNKFLIVQENRNENKNCKKKYQERKPGFALTLSPDLFSICHKDANLLTDILE